MRLPRRGDVSHAALVDLHVFAPQEDEGRIFAFLHKHIRNAGSRGPQEVRAQSAGSDLARTVP